MHYLVTGGAGFIGSHLVDALVEEGHKVTILDDLSTGKKENIQNNKLISFVEGDCGDATLVSSLITDIDGVFHLAAIASVQKCQEDWAASHRTNIGATVTLLESIKKTERKTPFVYASSAAVFGDPDASLIPLDEDAPHAPLSAYGIDKAACELHARIATEQFGIPTLGLRFFNVYGPRQDPSSPYSGVISIFSERIAKNEPITLFGDGSQTRDFVYISDIVSHITNTMRLLKSNRDAPLILHGCTGVQNSLLDLIKTLESITGNTAIVKKEESRPRDIVNSLGNPALLKQTFNINSHIELRDGLTALINYGN